MKFGLSNLALRKKASVFILMILSIIIGMMSYFSLPREWAPDVQIPLLIVNAPYPGASPEDVENLVTHKLETEFANLEYLKEMTSTSTESAAMVRLEFSLDFNVDDARTKVREAIDRVEPDLPDDVLDVTITEINLSERPIMRINISSDQGLEFLKNVAEDAQERMEAIPGILEVVRSGGLDKEIQVYVDPQKLRYYNLGINDVTNTISRENTSIPGGTLDIGTVKYMVRVPGEIEEPREIENMIMAYKDNTPIYIRDVATVEFAAKEVESRSRFFGQESVSLAVSKRTGENLIRISDAVKKIVAEEQEKLGDQVSFKILSDQSKFVNKMIADLENNIYTGLFFVLVVLLIAMGIRNAIFVAVAIPFSMLLSFMVIQWLGMTLNLVVLFSLILALGMLVDNAIVIVENIYRHLQSGKTKLQAAQIGVGEVAIPVITSTITTLAAFFPLIFMPGIMGDFMSYLPITLIITLISSLLVGLIFNPVVCATFMVAPKETQQIDEEELAESSKILTFYRKTLSWALDHRHWTMAIVTVVWILSIGSYVVLNQKGVEFFPTSEPREATIEVKAPFGTRLTESDRMVYQVENVLVPYQDKTDAIVSYVGKSNSSFLSSIVLAFPDWEHWVERPTKVIKNIRQQLNSIAGAEVKLEQEKGGPPTGKPVNIEISGQDLNLMKKISLDIQDRIKNVKGLVNLSDDFDSSRSEIRVLIDREKLSMFHLSTLEIASMIRTAVRGNDVSSYRVGKDEYDIVVRLQEKFRQSPSDLSELTILTRTGDIIPLKEVANIITAPSFGSIRHIDQKRVITVSGDNEGVPGPVILKNIQGLLQDYPFPDGYAIKYTGENEDRKESQSFLGKSFLIAIFLIFLVLVTQFNSVILPGVILSSVVLSFMGVFLGLTIHDRPFSIMMGGIGIISLAGVVVNNAIVLIDYIAQLRDKGKSVRDAVVLAGMLRLRPVFLTAITTILGMVPIAIGMDINFYRFPNIVVFGSEGGAMWVPMAHAVMYGLAVSTVLTLVVVPVLYSLIHSLKNFFRNRFSSLVRAWFRLLRRIIFRRKVV